ncbi:hypothetical protein T11_12021 [Trichinella zimbabwensis]|uniref:Uncharacterized protein n=2 Tax=Trichinella TaxID=6333 RepID=A0A0V1GWU2_9BILA|nr:hypothetical protein T11_12021 [Trichinella zimbabwensis]
MVIRVRRPEPFRQRLSGSTTGCGIFKAEPTDWQPTWVPWKRWWRRFTSEKLAQGRGISAILLSPQPLTEALHTVCILRNRSAEEVKSIPTIDDEAASSSEQ